MENKFMRVEEVAAELGVSTSYAYKVIRRLNDELNAKGFITVTGKINRQYFNERVYGFGKDGCTGRGCCRLVRTADRQALQLQLPQQDNTGQLLLQPAGMGGLQRPLQY